MLCYHIQQHGQTRLTKASLSLVATAYSLFRLITIGLLGMANKPRWVALQFRLGFNLMSHNVQSLKYRTGFFVAQLHAADIAIAGLQETRCLHSQLVRQDHFLRVTSAADNGHGGVELWLNTLQPEISRRWY